MLNFVLSIRNSIKQYPFFTLNFLKNNIVPMTLKTQYPINFLKNLLWNSPLSKMVLVIGLLLVCNEKVLSQDWKLDYGFEIYFGDNAEDQGNMSVDFGLVPIGSIGSTVFIDEDNNGTQDAGDAGIVGVTVELYLDANMDGIPDGAPIATTVTGTDGAYLFEM